MENDGPLLARILSAGYEKTYESTEWTVLTKDGKFFAIENQIDISAKLTGAYSEVVAGSYEYIGTLLADLIRMKRDYSGITERASRENALLILAALLVILVHTYYQSKTSGLEPSAIKYFLIGGLVILGVASFFSAIRSYQIRKEIIGAWPDRMKSYDYRTSALRRLDMELEKDRG